MQTEQRWDFWTVHGAEELSGINSSPARAAGEVVGKLNLTELFRIKKSRSGRDWVGKYLEDAGGCCLFSYKYIFVDHTPLRLLHCIWQDIRSEKKRLINLWSFHRNPSKVFPAKKGSKYFIYTISLTQSVFKVKPYLIKHERTWISKLWSLRTI